jgi:hypothetical protein
MAHYLVDGLPQAADEIFERGEEGIDVIEAPAVAVSEAIWSVVNKGKIAGVAVETTPNAVLRGLVTRSEWKPTRSRVGLSDNIP